MSTTNTFHCFINIIHSIQESSRELEAELETQIKQAEHQVRELRSNNHRLLIEHNSLKVIISRKTRFFYKLYGDIILLLYIFFKPGKIRSTQSRAPHSSERAGNACASTTSQKRRYNQANQTARANQR